MDAPTKYHYQKKLQSIKVKYFLVAGLILLAIAIVALRQNNFTMISLRDEVAKADQENGDVEAALQALRQHVHGHMNTNLSSGNNAIKPPIQLKVRYERLASSEQARAKQENAKITAEGEARCGAQFPAAGFNAQRVACVQEYVRANATSANPIPDSLYKFDFVSPKWSPDLAGWSLVASTSCFVTALVLFILKRPSRT